MKKFKFFAIRILLVIIILCAFVGIKVTAKQYEYKNKNDKIFKNINYSGEISLNDGMANISHRNYIDIRDIESIFGKNSIN